MAKLSLYFLSFTFFISLIISHIIPITSQEVENEKEFDYYNSTRWGEIHPEWSSCRNGSMQSPIDLFDERVNIVSHLGRLNRNYKPANATLKNRGHDMMLQWHDGGAGTIEINGTEYVLKQCHWHSPTEHTVNGERYLLELHMVHESKDGKYAVVGIMYKTGRPDTFLTSLTDKLVAVAGIKEEETAVGIVDPKQIQIGSRKYYRYIGSLTVPPCSENVLWTIVKKVRTTTTEQVRLLRVAVHDQSDTNARPIQKMNGRVVQLFRPDGTNQD
ncbi:alpha carbonic anhydrase 7 [Euphorbia peplus]|nr:alpha carbonic anhydrase 7 [Euphorbia peplus]